MKLIVILLTTIVVTISSCLLIAFKIALLQDEKGMFLYAFIMIAGNVLLPILFTTFLYAWLKKHIIANSRVLIYLKQLFLVALIFAIGIVLLTSSKVISYYSGFSGFTFYNLKATFDSCYSGFMGLLILATLLIPVTYYLLERKMKKVATQFNIKHEHH